MTTASGDLPALRRELDEARLRIDALERELAGVRQLESLGRMTASIAHDFGNVMAAISAQNELLLNGLEAGSTPRRRAEAIRKASAWGERLARELMAAGRPQTPGPALADLNSVVSGVARTVGPLLGDDVELTTAMDPAVGMVAIGVGSLEQVIVNLVLNARDAMPAGGRVTVATSVAPSANGSGPERPALLRVSDTGVGMDEATRARAFEPYFTTKPEGKGTGLGLSTVLEVVTRHGGHVEVTSDAGPGLDVRGDAAPGGRRLDVAHRARGGRRRAGVRDLIVRDPRAPRLTHV